MGRGWRVMGKEFLKFNNEILNFFYLDKPF